ncbi:hypothetical protein [Halobacterium sp. R2-5]|uniref:hypothetical protein n=1 Tax=Halobacterium sp. R2-5 TaxID=2715751 RepID=UPI00141F264E|nr:hypothetical protein [Halobacterium sp. R2-5]NIB98079.1 hypothetical protein [Halobacterium sp. R2-5]
MSELRVDSRWWYWVAAVPVVTAFWLVCSLWVAAVVVLVPEAVVSDAAAVVSIPAVALGVPALVAFLFLPLALWMDGRAVSAAGGDWPDSGPNDAGIALLADLLVLAGAALFFQGAAAAAVGVLGGAALGTWVAVRYLRQRSDHVAMPGSLWEWREELRADEPVR